jgi:HlyD family secretion protein
MPSRRVLVWVAVALAVAVPAGLWLSQPPALPAIQPQPQPMVRMLQFSARVATASRVDLGATITGRVAEVRVQAGDSVRAGQVLLRLEQAELQAALAQAQAAQRQAAARLAGLRSTGRRGARAGVAQVESVLHQALAERDRTRALVAQGFVSAARLDEAERAVAVALAQREAAQAQDAAGAEDGADIAQARAALALAEAATQAAQARLAQAEIRAPADARVLVRSVEPGQIVQPGRALLALALAGPVRLVAQVDERALRELALGQPVQAEADAWPGRRFAARVLSIAPLVDAQRGAVEVKFEPQPPVPDFLREDMTLSLAVESGRRDAALVLPLAALRRDDGAATGEAWVLQDGRVQARALRLGLRSAEAVEVVQGLAAGETVLLDDRVPPGGRARADAAAGR